MMIDCFVSIALEIELLRNDFLILLVSLVQEISGDVAFNSNG